MNEQNQTTAPGYGPSPGKESPVMEARPKPAKGQRWRDTGSTDFPVIGVFTLDGPSFLEGSWKISGGTGRNWVTAGWFESGRLEFVDHGEPQPALPAPAVPPAKAPGMWTCIRCGGRHPAVEKLCPTRKPKYGRLIGETRAPDGTPLSALQSIPCVRSSEDLKPKPPWVPSCDIDCDIPDAFPVRR